MSNFNIPNSITSIRLLIAFSIFYFLVKDNVITALILALIFVLLDALDGVLARRLKQETKFGNVFDIFTDTLCGAGIFLIRFFADKIPITISALAIINGLFFVLVEIYAFFKIKRCYVSKIRVFIAAFYNLFALLLILNLYKYQYLFFIVLAGMYFCSVYYLLEVRNVSKTTS